eukprot:gene13579-biopygen8036
MVGDPHHGGGSHHGWVAGWLGAGGVGMEWSILLSSSCGGGVDCVRPDRVGFRPYGRTDSCPGKLDRNRSQTDSLAQKQKVGVGKSESGSRRDAKSESRGDGKVGKVGVGGKSESRNWSWSQDEVGVK